MNSATSYTVREEIATNTRVVTIRKISYPFTHVKFAYRAKTAIIAHAYTLVYGAVWQQMACFTS
ncbi:MAG: hypothetical protein UY62_C0013G0010 [Parcubacteria group bacterium GW2011_GWF2_50_9]|nr:MAG: hypothetical protein UY62_C0013G0010 [Parcubacteria group bacterium GW2011_GWF2_50_9]